MAELSMPIEDLLGASLNGHVDAEQPPGPRVDAARNVFVTSKGDEIELSGKPINSLVLQEIINQGRPKIPMIEVTLLGKHKQLEANPNDPGYQALLAEWQADQQTRTAHYMFTVGVKGQPPQEFIDENSLLFPNASASQMKYLWIASLVPDADLDVFLEALAGRWQPTAKGVDESANFTVSPPTDSP